MTEYTEIDCRVIRTTDKAVLVEVDDGEEVWIPLSQVEDNGEDLKDGDKGVLFISEWWAEREGL